MNNNISKDVTIIIWYLKHDHSWRTYVSRFRWRGVEVRQVFLVSTQLVQVLYGINTHCFRHWFGQLKWEYTQIAPQRGTQFTSNTKSSYHVGVRRATVANCNANGVVRQTSRTFEPRGKLRAFPRILHSTRVIGQPIRA